MQRGGRARGDAGFLLFEVLVAAALLGFAGTIVLLIGSNILAAQDRALDRSVALTNLTSLMQDLMLVGAEGAGEVLPYEDAVFAYRMLPTEVPDGAEPVPEALRAVRVEAQAKRGGSGPPIGFDLLIPVARRAAPPSP